MNVIFLDLSGVLHAGREGFEPSSVCYLLTVVRAMGACIVLTSDWVKRGHGRYAQVVQMLEEVGIEIYDRTEQPEDSYLDQRGAQIQQWLMLYPEVRGYVILDDCDLRDLGDNSLPERMWPHFVHVDRGRLSARDTMMAIEALLLPSTERQLRPPEACGAS